MSIFNLALFSFTRNAYVVTTVMFAFALPASLRGQNISPDSLSISYENGRLKLPDVPKGSGKKHAEDAAKHKLPTDSKTELQNKGLEDTRKKISDKAKINTKVQTSQSRTDSIRQLITEGQDLASQLQNGTIPPRVYSNRALKKLYDSLGIGRLDSIKALTPIKKDMGKDDLLKALNQPMPTSPITEPVDKPSDLMNLAGKETQIPQVPDLANVKLPDSTLRDLMPARAFKFPADSLGILDSMRNINLSREKLTLNEHDVDEHLKTAVVKDTPRFWDKAYFEGVFAFVQNKDLDAFQFAPAMGYRIKSNLSVGLGPTAYISKIEKKWNIDIGYRVFAKYEIFNQMAYVHAEDMVDPRTQSKEKTSRTPHSILAGGGYVQPIFGSIAINLCVLYRVNNNAYADGQISPWVIRLGLSTRKNTDKKVK